MPLNKNYDKLIDSKNADTKYELCYIDRPQLLNLQRFILNKTPWAHLDIAGMAFSKYGGALNSGGATGYGALLNKLIEDNYNIEQTLSIIKPDAVERNLEMKLRRCLKTKVFLF